METGSDCTGPSDEIEVHGEGTTFKVKLGRKVRHEHREREAPQKAS